MVQISYIYAYNVEAGQSTGVSALASFLPKNTHWKRLWCWEGLGAGGEGDDRGWDGWMASPTRLTWVWVNSGSWWWTGRPGRLQSMGSQRVGHDWATELNWTGNLTSFSVWFMTGAYPKCFQANSACWKEQGIWIQCHLSPQLVKFWR